MCDRRRTAVRLGYEALRPVAPIGDSHVLARNGLPPVLHRCTPRVAPRRNTLQQCSPLQHGSRPCTGVHDALRHGAIRCNSAARCNAVRCCMFVRSCRLPMRIGTRPRCAAPTAIAHAACCSSHTMLQRAAPRCDAVYRAALRCNIVHHVATRCNVVQRGAPWRNVAQTVLPS